MTNHTTPRIAVVGCGHWGRNLARNFSAIGALAAVSDADPASAREVSETTGTPSRAYDDILRDPGINGIAIATPPATHAPLAIAALKSAKHVFVEKPMALDLADAEAMCELADRQDRHLMVGHLLQYHPAFRELRNLVSAGGLGRLQYIYSNRLNLGRFRREENILWSFAPHDISMMMALAGEAPEEVSAIGHSYLHKSIADITTTHLRFPAGTNGHIFVSWLHPYKDHKVVVVGDAGMAVFDDAATWPEKLRLYRHEVVWKDGLPQPSKAEHELIPAPEEEPLAAECRHFLDCIQDGIRPRTDGAEGLSVLRILQAAETSMRRNGQPTKLADRPTQPTASDVSIHHTATVDDGVEIGKGTKIWHYTHILPNVKIGADCIIGQNVMAGPRVTIGARCKIQNNVSLYRGVTLEDGVFCGPSCVFTNVRTPRAEVERKDEFEPTLVCRGATIGANATIMCGVTLGEYCLVGAGATVTRDVLPYALVAGTPARRIGWVSRSGDRLADDLQCPRTGERYELDGTGQLQPAASGD